LDVSKNMIAVGILRWDEQVPDTEMLFNDEASVRRLVDRFGDCAGLRTCYEAGPTGFGLRRLLRSMGVACEVIAPALIPKAPGDRVKTDRRDCRRLARLHQAGELVAIRIPSEAEEAVRDLCRARAAVVGDPDPDQPPVEQVPAAPRRVWRESAWTFRHEQWLLGQRFADPALQTTYAHYRAMLAAREAELAALESDPTHWYTHGPFTDAVARLAAYRGVAYVGALSIASEVGDWRRFPAARTFMGVTGLVPSEYSSGEAVRRGHITTGLISKPLSSNAVSYPGNRVPDAGAPLFRLGAEFDRASVARLDLLNRAAAGSLPGQLDSSILGADLAVGRMGEGQLFVDVDHVTGVGGADHKGTYHGLDTVGGLWLHVAHHPHEKRVSVPSMDAS
jgi:transposase